MPHDLIIDVGAHNGDDTGYYLQKGFQVVAVEANPILAEQIAGRFPDAVCNGRLTVLNIGIAEQTGELLFWVNDDQSRWSSLDRDLAGRHGSRCHSVVVPCLPLASIIREHGVPYYLKIDIEGYDRICLDSLKVGQCPRYLSCELTHGDGLIEQLHDLGYRRFTLVNQSTYTDAIPVFDDQISYRVLRKLCVCVPAVKRLLPDGVRSDFDTFTLQRGYRFPEGSSGPFGEETYGPWRGKDEIVRRYDHIRSRFLRAAVPLEHCWYDVHARAFREGNDRVSR
jgi:FkbM family methyltransferase